MTRTGPNRRLDTWTRFQSVLRVFLAAVEGKQALQLLAGLIAFLVVINGLNVLNSYVGRDFMSAIEHRDSAGFLKEAWLFVGVFALSTVAAAVYSFMEQTLDLLWRSWQTRRLLDRYLDRGAYYRLSYDDTVPNPDQRIAEDVRCFTATSVSFVLLMLNASITVVAFSGVLWTISPRLMVAAVVYALTGSILAMRLGRGLVGLNARQLDQEADFRSELIQVRDHAEPVALLHGEAFVRHRVLDRLDLLVANSRRIIAVSRNLSFFSNGYNYLIQIIPALVVAPLFIHGDIEFGVVTQSAMAFAQLMGAFSLAITQFQSISSYAATVTRLSTLTESIEKDSGPQAGFPSVECNEADHVIYDRLTLRDAAGQALIKDLSVAVGPGMRVLVSGTSGHAKVALFKATAGLRCPGEGRILRPDAQAMMFLPERPYLPRCTLRQAVVLPSALGEVSTGRILDILRRLELGALLEETGSVDVERDWQRTAGISEQARLLVARIVLARPACVFLDRITTAMDTAQAQGVLKLLDESGLAYILLGKSVDCTDGFDAILELGTAGSWTWRSLKS